MWEVNSLLLKTDFFFVLIKHQLYRKLFLVFRWDGSHVMLLAALVVLELGPPDLTFNLG